METYVWEPEDTLAEYLFDNGEKVFFARWCSVLQELLTDTNWDVTMPNGGAKVLLMIVEKDFELMFSRQAIYNHRLTPTSVLEEAKKWLWLFEEELK